MDLDEIKRGLRAEIKKREKEQYFTFQCNVRQMCKDVLAKLEEQESVIAELKAENERLRKELWEADEMAIDAGATSVEKMEETRKLQHALWLARAERAEARKNYWYARSCHEGDKEVWSIDGSAVKYIGCIKRTNFDWLKVWSEVECKCRAYADKFKEGK